MIDLDQKDNSNSIFEILYQGKAKTFVSASFTNEEVAVFGDWGCNIWAIDLASKKKIWENKIQKPILFDLISYKNRLFAFNEKSFFEINTATGEISELLAFKTVTSVVRVENKIFLNERNKNGFDTLGKILEIDLESLNTRIIYTEKERRTYGPLYRKEIINIGKDILFYADKSLFVYSLDDQSLKEIYNDQRINNQVEGLTALGSNLLFIPCIINENAGKFHFPPNPNINSIFIYTTNGQVEQVDKTAVMNTTCYFGSQVEVSPKYYISTLGSYVFFYDSFSITMKEVPGRRVTGTDCVLYKRGDEIYLFEPCSYGDRAEEMGFRLYTINWAGFSIDLVEEFKTARLGKNYKGSYFDIFGDHIVVRGDGRYFVLRKK